VALTRCRCADCGKLTAPVVPGACLPKTQFTASFVAHLLHDTYTLHLALERIRGELARQQLLDAAPQRMLGLLPDIRVDRGTRLQLQTTADPPHQYTSSGVTRSARPPRDTYSASTPLLSASQGVWAAKVPSTTSAQ